MAARYFDQHWKTLNALDAAGFKVNQSRKLVKNFDEVWTFIQKREARREALPYEIDGIVIKVDRTALQRELGFTGQSSALGDCLQICRAIGDHQDRRHSGASRSHRQAHSGRGVEAGADRRNHGQPRDAAQHG